MNIKKAALLTAMVTCLASASAQGAIRITEWMYDGSNGEFIELTNIGNTPISLTGWSYDDDSRLAGTVSLSGFGTIQPQESVVLAEANADDFRAAWNLPASVKIVGGNTTNLGRNDEINIYDAANSLVDRLTFGDQNLPGTIRTQGRSGNPVSLAALGTNDVSQWLFSSVGDDFGSYMSTGGQVGNPGAYPMAPVPEPSALVLLAIGGLALVARRMKHFVRAGKTA